MKEGTSPNPPAPPPERSGNVFRKVFLWTAIPLAALAVLDLVLARLIFRLFAPSGVAGFFLVSLRSLLATLWLVALFTAIGFAIAGKRQIAAGMFAGAGIGLVALGLTCFGFL